MSLRLRRLRVDVDTSRGPFGVDIPFDDGLVILRADNTSGKSTCIQAVVYALGLEGMLGPSRAVPLPHAVTTRILDERDHTEVPVHQSQVRLEVENGQGEIITVQRWVRNDSVDRRLITVRSGPMLSKPDSRSRQYFVLMPGAAQRAAGFHNFLARFLGWELPEVPRYDNSTGPLYLECIFPLFIIEQKRGWAGILTQMPTYLRVREPGRRAVEFVLALDTQVRALKMQALEARLQELRLSWAGTLERFEGRATPLGAVVQNVTRNRVATWSSDAPPTVMVSRSDRWLLIPDALVEIRSRLSELLGTDIPSAIASDVTTVEELARAEEELQQTAIAVAREQQDVASAHANVEATSQRLASLREDLYRYQDTATLRRLGSVDALSVNRGHCPTCHQEVSDAVLLDIDISEVMPLEENIAFIQEQIATFQLLEADATRALRGQEAHLQSLRLHLHDTRRAVRELRETLNGNATSASAAAVAERIQDS